MSNINFILEDSADKDNLLKSALIDSNIPFVYLKQDNLKASLLYIKSVIFGSISFCQEAEKLKLDCYPGVDWFKYNSNFDYVETFKNFRDIFVNPEIELLSYTALIEQKWDLYYSLANEAKIFIRPNSTYKPFPGSLVDIQDFENYIEREAELRPKILKERVCVAKPKKIRAEWRFICSKNSIVCSSLYKYQDLISLVSGAPPQAVKIAQKVVDAQLNLPYMYVVDVCMLETGEFKLLELNPINSAGLYKCDRYKIVQKINEYSATKT